MLRRIELAWPVTDPAIRQRIIDECLVAYLHDGVDAWDLQPDGRYIRTAGASSDSASNGAAEEHRPPAGAQAALMARYAARSHDFSVPSRKRK